jgi:inner membrane protein
MDNLTHTLFGLVLAKTGLERTTPRATAALLIGANFPDVDLVTLLGGNISYLRYHRGISHSVAGIVGQAFLLAGIIHFSHRSFSNTTIPVRFGMLYLMALVGMGSHFVLDYSNSYGVRPFLPFNGRWFAADLVFIVDPWMIACLGLGLGIPFLFQLIYKEIGAKPTGYRFGALVSLAFVVAFWSCKYVSYHEALQGLLKRTYSTGVPSRVNAFPQFLNPFGWHGIVETEKAYHLNFVGWSVFRSEFERRRVRTLHKSDDTEVVASALKGEQARVFMDFARFPLAQVHPYPEGYEVTIRDLRFDFASRFRQGFLHTVLLDKSLNVKSERFRF